MLLTTILAAASSAALVTIADPGGKLSASISPEHGGELSSLRVQFRGQWVETLYRAEDYSATAGWTGRAPWLWPATGKGDPLPAHGFARDLPWRVVSRARDRVRVALDSSSRTAAFHFPHGFRLEAEYRFMAGGKLAITFTAAAAKSNSGPMPFSAGNHITFRTPLLNGSDPLAMTLETPSTVEYLKANRVPTGETRERNLATPTPLGKLPKLDAVSLGGYAGGAAGEAWMVLRDPGGLGIRMKHSASGGPASGPVVRFNVWGDPADGYFSPEPWVGLQNAHQSKQGLTWLKPGERWEWRIEIEPLVP